MKIRFVTGNKQKFEEARLILKDWDLLRVEMDLEEIQGTHREVIEAKVRRASAMLQCPLIVEDVSIACACLNGLPGPFAKDFLRCLGDQKMYELVHKYDDHRAECVCMAAFMEPGENPVIFEGAVRGSIVAPRGDVHHGKYSWNAIFQPEGLDKTFGEMPISQHSTLSHRRLALDKLKHYLESRYSHERSRSHHTRVLESTAHPTPQP